MWLPLIKALSYVFKCEYSDQNCSVVYVIAKQYQSVGKHGNLDAISSAAGSAFKTIFFISMKCLNVFQGLIG